MAQKNTKETIQDQLDTLYKTVQELQDKMNDISSNTESKDPAPYAKANAYSSLHISDLKNSIDGFLIWNDAELKIPPFGQKPDEPTVGYLKHFHTRYAGGALDINAMEFVQYNIDWDTDATHSKHSQQLWKDQPAILQMENAKNEKIDMIGKLDMLFDVENKIWSAVPHFINVEKVFLVQIDPLTGLPKLDINGKPMQSPLLNTSDPTKSSVIWDTSALCWRFFAVYTQDPI